MPADEEGDDEDDEAEILAGGDFQGGFQAGGGLPEGFSFDDVETEEL